MRATKILWAELALIFIGLPLLVAFSPTKATVHAPILCGALISILWLRRQTGFSWRDMWHGTGWPAQQRTKALLRFMLLTPCLAGLAYVLQPDRLFAFPTERPLFWLVVMVLYPVLSVIPQEILFRTMFFRRYAPVMPSPRVLYTVNGFVFGWAHIVFHNPISPLLCLIGGVMFAVNYQHHRSLKWAVVEHALYGCMIFTVGLGKYFLVNPLIKV